MNDTHIPQTPTIKITVCKSELCVKGFAGERVSLVLYNAAGVADPM